MIYLRGAMALLSASSLLTKILIGLGLAATLLAAYGEWHHRVYREGANAAIAGIARADKGWIDRASAARSKWKDCNAQNRGWDQTTGKCL
jgi:hypothetical protein